MHQGRDGLVSKKRKNEMGRLDKSVFDGGDLLE